MDEEVLECGKLEWGNFGMWREFLIGETSYFNWLSDAGNIEELMDVPLPTNNTM